MDFFENIFLILGMVIMLAGIFLEFGLGIALICGGVMLILLSFVIAKGTGYGKTTNFDK